jgi:dsRNA-specific ribonuclease
MILLLANFVLKSLEVNLSVKESALNVALEILETNPRVQNIDLVRLTINMMKSNYVGKNLSHYLAKLIKRLSQEELGVILYRLFEFSPLARTKLLTELLNHNDPLICPVWMSTQMWIMQFDEEFFSLARKVWNKFGLVLRSGLLDLNKERDYWNIYYHMRSDNIAIFDMTVKAVIAAIEIMHGKFGQVIDDLLKFYFSEIVVVRQMNLEALRRTGDDNNFEGIKRFNRIAVPKIILKTSSLVPVQSI